jgi:hypothetical protein
MMAGEAGKVKISLTEEQTIGESVRASLQTYVAGLTVPQKVELAGKGNSEVRRILSRDNSSMVARAVINSPRLSERDVLDYAIAPTTHEDILRAIGDSREWVNKPRIPSILVANPKTPPPVSLRLVLRLPLGELDRLSRNPAIPMVVRREAKRLLVRKRV